MAKDETVSARRWMARFDPGLGAAFVFACVSAWPLLSKPSLPRLTDAQHHIYRAYEILAAWREGILYTRWAPDFYYMYGYPVFNFYAPFTHYLAAAYGLFFGPVAGVKFGLVLATFLGTLGVYLFGRVHWGPLPAAVSAAVYAAAPYITLIDPVIRGALPEAFAIGLGPIVLWAFTGLARTNSRRFFVLAVASLAMLIASHNLLSFVLLGFTMAWIIWEAAVLHRPTSAAGWVEALSRPAAAGLMAAGLTAFIWLPAVLERGTVQYTRGFGALPANRYTSAQNLLSFTTPTEAQAFDAADFPYRIGVPQWIFGLVGALTVSRPWRQRRATLFFALVALACFTLMVPQADPIWHLIPVLPYLQFSYRLLGVLVPCLAWLAGAAVAWVAARWPKARLGFAAAVAGMSLLAAVPILTPLPWPDFGPVTPKAIFDFDIYGLRGIGTTNDGEFLPVTVVWHPTERPDVAAAVAAGTVEKVDRAALPAGAEVTNTRHGTLSDEFAINAPEGFALRVLTFYWPGWTAYLDGARVPIQVTDPEGFISVAIPAGTHSLTLQLEDTTPRRLGWLISAAALAALVGLVLAAPAWRGGKAAIEPQRPATLPAWPALVLVGLSAAAIGLRMAWDANLRWHAANDVPRVAGAQVQQFTRFDNGMALVAYDLQATQARPGDKVTLTFYWKVTRSMPMPGSVFVHFYGPNGTLFGQADKPDPVVYVPTTRWPLGLVREDVEVAVLKPDAPPGVYTVAVGLWDRSTGQRSHPLDAAGQPTDQEKLILTNQFTVTP